MALRTIPAAVGELDRQTRRISCSGLRTRPALSDSSHSSWNALRDVEFDSDIEHRFAKALDNNEDVRFYLRLPSWFTVDTPTGPYYPRLPPSLGK